MINTKIKPLVLALAIPVFIAGCNSSSNNSPTSITYTGKTEAAEITALRI